MKTTFRVQSHLANDMSGDYLGEWKDGAFVWSMDIPRLAQVLRDAHEAPGS